MRNPYFGRAIKFCRLCHSYEKSSYRSDFSENVNAIRNRICEGNSDFANAQVLQALEKAYTFEGKDSSTANVSGIEFIKNLIDTCVGCEYEEPKIAKLIAEKNG